MSHFRLRRELVEGLDGVDGALDDVEGDAVVGDLEESDGGGGTVDLVDDGGSGGGEVDYWDGVGGGSSGLGGVWEGVGWVVEDAGNGGGGEARVEEAFDAEFGVVELFDFFEAVVVLWWLVGGEGER